MATLLHTKFNIIYSNLMHVNISKYEDDHTFCIIYYFVFTNVYYNYEATILYEVY